LIEHQTHYSSYLGQVFTGHMTQPTVKALKEDRVLRIRFNPIRSIPPRSQ